MPRTEAVSSITLFFLIFLSPSPATQAWWLFNLPFTLFIRVTLIILSAIAYPIICSTESPRFSATLSGERIFCSPLKVARTTLTGVVDP